MMIDRRSKKYPFDGSGICIKNPAKLGGKTIFDPCDSGEKSIPFPFMQATATKFERLFASFMFPLSRNMGVE